MTIFDYLIDYASYYECFVEEARQLSENKPKTWEE
jgi:hypothetical protein